MAVFVADALIDRWVLNDAFVCWMRAFGKDYA